MKNRRLWVFRVVNANFPVQIFASLLLTISSMAYLYSSSDGFQEEVVTSEITKIEVFAYNMLMKGTPLKKLQLKMPIKLHKFSNTLQSSPLLSGPGHCSPSPPFEQLSQEFTPVYNHYSQIGSLVGVHL